MFAVILRFYTCSILVLDFGSGFFVFEVFLFSFGGIFGGLTNICEIACWLVATADPILNPHKHEGERYK